MDVSIRETEESKLNEWISDQKSYGWCWFEDNKPRATLWNFNTNTTSNLETMLIRATKLNINKDRAKTALEKKLPIISGVRFAPSKPQVLTLNGCNFINTFKDMRWMDSTQTMISDGEDEAVYLNDLIEQSADVDMFLEFIERLTSNNGDEQWLLGWLAHMIQKPEERPSVHPLFRTEHGLGKNVLVEVVMNKLLCKQTVTTSLKEIRGSHSESAANNLLVFVDESKAKGMNVYLEMKSLLTTKELLVNPKHERAYKQEIYSRFMFADNTQGRAFNIEQEDRRIYVMEYAVHEKDKEETQAFIEEFLDWFSMYWNYVYGYLRQYDISKWNPHVCPMTDAKMEYLEMCQDPVDALLNEYIQSGWRSLDKSRWNAIIESNDLLNNYSWEILSCSDGFKYQLEHAGFEKKRVGTSRETGYFLTNLGLTNNQKYELLIQERYQFSHRFSEVHNTTIQNQPEYSV